MLFELKETGTVLQQGRFYHHNVCKNKSGYSSSEIDFIEAKKADFNVVGLKAIRDEKIRVGNHVKIVREDFSEPEFQGASGYGVVEKLLDGVDRLEMQFKTFFDV
ncbi:hypothetical protein [Endozoicomonas atrinae]|uniref:hypothetical protein n=1 Tax=Endozoicomonas atrinae TaxID=1333660 RepID=UPI003AFFDAA7